MSVDLQLRKSDTNQVIESIRGTKKNQFQGTDHKHLIATATVLLLITVIVKIVVW